MLDYRWRLTVLVVLVVMATDMLAAAETAATARGPGGSGRYAVSGLPTSWSENSNVRWKADLTFSGWGSPVVWQDRVVVVGADAEIRKVWCFKTSDGTLLWEVSLPAVVGLTKDYATDTMIEEWDVRMYAAATPATDGKHVFVMFSVGQLAALSLADGKVVWNVALGDTTSNKYGLTSSLLLFNGLLIVVFEGDAKFIAGYDAATGQQRWKAERKNATSASPILIKTASGKDQVVLIADPDATAWDPASGKTLWSIDILGGSPDYCVGSSPIFNGKFVFVNSQNAGIYAIDPDKGEKVWGCEALRECPGFADGVSMTTDGKYVYQFFDYYLVCLDADSGTVVKEHELDQMASYASPFVNGKHLYLFTLDGVLVVSADPEKDFPVVGKGSLNDEIEANPAVVDGTLFIRADKTLYCIGK